MPRPASPKLYHIVHKDKLLYIMDGGFLISDAEVRVRGPIPGTTIGMQTIKDRRLKNSLRSYTDLTVGQCVPFYFCYRSIMLYLLHRGNHPDLAYRGGQSPILHLEFDLNSVANWANANALRWAFTLSNAGSKFFEERNHLEQLDDINWDAIKAQNWQAPDIKEAKQAEFLVERHVPWTLVERIGVIDEKAQGAVQQVLVRCGHRPPVDIQRDWYY